LIIPIGGQNLFENRISNPVIMKFLLLPCEKYVKIIGNKFVREVKRYTFATAIEKHN